MYITLTELLALLTFIVILIDLIINIFRRK